MAGTPADKKSTDVMLKAAQESGLAIPQDVDFSAFGSTEIDETQDLRTPRLSVAQPTSDAVVAGEVQMGEFYYAATGRGLGKKIKFQILGYWTGRQYINERKVLCRSFDRNTGEPTDPQEFQPKDVAGQPTTSCGACVMSKWHGRQTPPPCDVTYNYAVLVSSAKEPDKKWMAYLTLRRTTTDLAKKLNGDHLADGKPWFAYIYEAETVPQRNEQGNWFIISATRAAEATPDQMQEAHDEALRLVERIKASRIDAVLDTETADDEIPV